MSIRTVTYVLIVLVIGVFAVSCSLENLPDAVGAGDSGQDQSEGGSGGSEKEEKETGGDTDPDSEKETGDEPDPDPGFEPFDFTGVEDGTSLEEYGFIVGADDAGEPGFIIRNGVIESDGTAGGWLTLEFPDFHIDRMENGGVSVTWEVRYPEFLMPGSRERSKFYVSLTDADSTPVYEFEYKPFLLDGDNREVALIVDGERTTADQMYLTPSSFLAPWLSFRMDLLDTGQIIVYYDYWGFGWVELISIFDSSYTVFEGIQFTYRTTAEPMYYPIQLRELSVQPLNQ